MRATYLNSGKCMPVTDIPEELKALHIRVQAFMQLQSRRSDRDAGNICPITSHFIVLLARGHDVMKVRSLTELCGLRAWTVRTIRC